MAGGILIHHVLRFDEAHNLIRDPGNRKVTALSETEFEPFKDYSDNELVGGDSVLSITASKNTLITISIGDELLNWRFWKNDEARFKKTVFEQQAISIEGSSKGFDFVKSGDRMLTFHHSNSEEPASKFNLYIENTLYRDGLERSTKLIVDPVVRNSGGGVGGD